ncbi:TPA: response regulator transcription factor [Streptococcus agalactiae]|jgi:response regulator vanRG|uniref:Response regulator receiver domain protein n=3 Tax=Peptoniphilaceae TaxID=1570339 RepID=C2BCT1_9FIRM|nr:MULTISPECIES: response regulator transcription factor [Peptoniphilaceae]HBC4440196.1 response regulator transcription factor [Enterococcus faecalis]HEO4576021.1 response regulator transcription factor [Streptococcus agalactiae]HER1697206.1 response regulator transcription factor [Streptococcus pyogenes]EEI87285.1 response regulator receiver domain protein [Anaerococcus lactolyticus ATCC 51172]EGC84627.1 response regulator receiver domain protein [Anaerococcus hydrogenalis ACS-025-V-Sch4]
MNYSVLVVEDDESILDLIEIYLENENYIIKKATCSEEAIRYIKEEEFDLAILDIMLPDKDGYYLCKKIRESFNYPIIMLTSKDDESSKIKGLTFGADDYVTKPFLPGELVARVKAQLRRYNNYNLKTKEGTGNILTYQNVDLNIKSREVLVDGQEIDLTPIEFIILKSLLEKKSEVLGSEDLFYKIYPDEYYIKNNTVSVHIRHIREKLGEKNNIITTVWGVGYKIG